MADKPVISGLKRGGLPFSQYREAAERLSVERAEEFPSEDPTLSGPSLSLSRSAGAAGACGTASAAGLTRKRNAGVTAQLLFFFLTLK